MANNYSTSTDAFIDMSEANFASSDYAQMAGFVTSASRLIDAEVGRWEGFFNPTTDSATYYYDGSGGEELEIDEFVSISEVAVSEQGGTASTDYTVWSSTDYLTYPHNYSAKGKPINKLVVDFNGSKPGWYGYRKAVKITGVPGYASTTPDLVALACRTQANIWFMKARNSWQEQAGSDNVGRLVYTKLDKSVIDILWPLKLELER